MSASMLIQWLHQRFIKDERHEGSGSALTHQQGREHHMVAEAVRKGGMQGRGVRRG